MTPEISKALDGMHAAREAGLTGCRALIQQCSKAIRAMHRESFADAEAILVEARNLSRSTQETLEPYPEVKYAGFLRDAEKELAEAEATFAMLQDLPLPDAEQVGVGIVAYLHGVGEAASELRRFILDLLRRGQFDRAESLFARMESVYDDLIELDYPDGMTSGLRRTTDALRAVVERTRSDLTATSQQQALVKDLQDAKRLLER